MAESLASTAQYTLHVSADATGLLALRREIKASPGVPDITVNVLVVFCAIQAVLEVPAVNAELIDGRLYQRAHVNLGFACDTPRGLVVPVVRSCEELSVAELSGRMSALAAQAVEGTLGADDMVDATFTVSNLGVLGVESFTPVINPPQVAILGVDAITLRPVRKPDGSVEIRRLHRSFGDLRPPGDRRCARGEIPQCPQAKDCERAVDMFDLIVIGAGPGGYEAAAHAGSLGKSVAIVEKAELGGTCLNVGCIPAKTFLRSSRLFRECREAALFGVVVEELSFDLPALLARKDKVVGTLKRGVSALLRDTSVEVVHGTGRLVGRNAVEVAGERYEATNVLIATGSRPAVPPIPGIDGDRVLDSTAAFELTSVPERIAIIGGGYIGLEFASFFHEIGTKVTVYEALPRIASGCDADIAEELLKILRRGGIEIHLSCSVLSVDGDKLHYQDASGAEQSDSATYILNATGRTPVITDLGLEEAGVDVSGRGIPVNAQGRTNVPNIWACGDVTGRQMLAARGGSPGDSGCQLDVRPARSHALRRSAGGHLLAPRGVDGGQDRGGAEGGLRRVPQGRGADGSGRPLSGRAREGDRSLKGAGRRWERRDPRRSRDRRPVERVHRGCGNDDRGRDDLGPGRRGHLPASDRSRGAARSDPQGSVTVG